jgi:hypothetical protein
MAGAPIGRGRPILTVKRGWRSRPSRCARGLSAQRRLGGGEAGDRCSRPGCADQNKGPERLSVGNRLVGVLSTTSLGTVLLAAQHAATFRTAVDAAALLVLRSGFGVQ